MIAEFGMFRNSSSLYHQTFSLSREKLLEFFNIGTLEWVAPYVALIRTRDTTQHRHYTDTLAQNLKNWRIRRVRGHIMENIYVYYHMNNL